MELENVYQPIIKLVNNELMNLLLNSKQQDLKLNNSTTHKSETRTIISYGTILLVATDFEDLVQEMNQLIIDVIKLYSIHEKQLTPVDKRVISACHNIIPEMEMVEIDERYIMRKTLIIQYVLNFIRMIENLTQTSIIMISDCIAKKIINERLPNLVQDVNDRISEITNGRFTSLNDALNAIINNKIKTEQSGDISNPTDDEKFEAIKKQLNNPNMSIVDKRKLFQQTMIECYESHPEQCKSCKSKAFCEDVRNGKLPPLPTI